MQKLIQVQVLESNWQYSPDTSKSTLAAYTTCQISCHLSTVYNVNAILELKFKYFKTLLVILTLFSKIAHYSDI